MPTVKLYLPVKLLSEVQDIKDILSECAISLFEARFEYCFYIDCGERKPSDDDLAVLKWLIEQPFSEHKSKNLDKRLGRVSGISQLGEGVESFQCMDEFSTQFEIGPRLNYSTPWSTNAVAICAYAGLDFVSRMERSRRYRLITSNPVVEEVKNKIISMLHDQMTEIVYERPIDSFALSTKPSPVYEVNILKDGRKALTEVNQDMGLAMDDWDLDFYTDMFKNKMGRNPTNVECFDLAQSNSEHSRHWFFGGRLVIDGFEMDNSLFKLVKSTQENTNPNNKIKFSDNSSAIEGFEVKTFRPSKIGKSSKFLLESSILHIILTAETHNFPTAVAPFPGATTGTGGRIRDVQATGRGANVVAGTAGYCFGCLHLPGHKLPWENSSFEYPPNFASPLQVIIDASNGASDYGNKYGEPVICGFARSFGLFLNGSRREWVKPIMFSAGIGSIYDEHLQKKPPQAGDLVVKVGGPVYRIGVGGGAASSIQVQGDNVSELDLGAVQRGDAEMEQKMNRVIRACIECREKNPILSIHDQGAGGNGNVLKEISDPEGAKIHCDGFSLGDPTISVLELWGAEYQESNALLIKPADRPLVERVANREKCPVSFVGEITGNKKIQLTPFGHLDDVSQDGSEALKKKTPILPVDLQLDLVLGDMPKKVFKMRRITPLANPFVLPPEQTFRNMLEAVLRMPSVASKRFLTNKVDRSVTGLIAQQQCVGPLHTPLADVAVTSISYWDTKGAATAIGEQPIKMLVSAECGARMSVGESLTNLSFALISHLKDVKCSANWMWPGKLEGEGPLMYDACRAMCEVMKQLGIGIDGGKDSLSMAARVGEVTVKAPGSLVISSYAPCVNICKTVTPDLKCPHGKGELFYINLSKGQCSQRLGGSAIAHVYGQIGDESPDLDDSQLFIKCFRTIQSLIRDGLITAGHDVSDGGFIVTLFEMAFAGDCGFRVNLPCQPDSVMSLAQLFHEELGYILEVRTTDSAKVTAMLEESGIIFQHLGVSTVDRTCTLSSVDGSSRTTFLSESVAKLRDSWEETSFKLDALQCNPVCVSQERERLLASDLPPPYKLTFDIEEPKLSTLAHPDAPRVAIVREEGTNGDRELAAAFLTAGFEVHDLTMTDLISGAISLDEFQGLGFAGGFAFADVMGSAKGWASSILRKESVKKQFQNFFERDDTFSLGVCNGCQVMTLLGWVGSVQFSDGKTESVQSGVYMGHNTSGRYESRFSTVSINKSPSIMLRGMSGSTLGIWVAHGEGKMIFRNSDVYSDLVENNLLPLTFVDNSNNPTEGYPCNPNGSQDGIAALCSANGRHLAMMPHPERCFMTWQWPWMPQDWRGTVLRGTVKTSPWLKMFQNAYDWCLGQVDE
ncbi:phosphoribosylformylglycinamidine synthase-like [Watersipora subatra]|uniref:phosphoribosylformylglycinamidine synthase-like n=1 Tax=Watersipora subatra TaxID=2589382 RepID=UPI00355B01A5